MTKIEWGKKFAIEGILMHYGFFSKSSLQELQVFNVNLSMEVEQMLEKLWHLEFHDELE
jgi:hypothetical protein